MRRFGVRFGCVRGWVSSVPVLVSRGPRAPGRSVRGQHVGPRPLAPLGSEARKKNSCPVLVLSRCANPRPRKCREPEGRACSPPRRPPSEATPRCRRRTAAASFPWQKNGGRGKPSQLQIIDRSWEADFCNWDRVNKVSTQMAKTSIPRRNFSESRAGAGGNFTAMPEFEIFCMRCTGIILIPPDPIERLDVCKTSKA